MAITDDNSGIAVARAARAGLRARLNSTSTRRRNFKYAFGREAFRNLLAYGGQRTARVSTQPAVETAPASPINPVSVEPITCRDAETQALHGLYIKTKKLAGQIKDIPASDTETQDVQHMVSRAPWEIQKRMGDVSGSPAASYQTTLGIRLTKMLGFTFSRASDLGRSQKNEAITALADECGAIASSLEDKLSRSSVQVAPATNAQDAVKDTARAQPQVKESILSKGTHKLKALWDDAHYALTHKAETLQRIKTNAYENRHSIALGFATGSGVRILFVSAAVATTLPATLGAAALAGIATNLSITAYQHYKTGHSSLGAYGAAMLKGALGGVVGGLFGVAVKEGVSGLINHFFSPKLASITPLAAVVPSAPAVPLEVVPPTYALIEGTMPTDAASSQVGVAPADLIAHSEPGVDFGAPAEPGMAPVEVPSLPSLPSVELAPGQSTPDLGNLAETRDVPEPKLVVVVDALTQAKSQGTELISSGKLNKFADLKLKAEGALARGDMRSFVSSVSEAGARQIQTGSREAGAVLTRFAATTAEQFGLNDEAMNVVYANQAYAEIHGKGTAKNLVSGTRWADLAGDKGADLGKLARAQMKAPLRLMAALRPAA